MASKKDNARNAELLAKRGIAVSIDVEAGTVSENIDDVVAKTKALLSATEEFSFYASPEDIIATRDTLRAAKDETARAVKAAKTEYDVPFAVIDAKLKALNVSLDKKLAVAESIAAIAENAQGSSPEIQRRNDLYAYFKEHAAWLGPKFGPLVWSKHPTAWDSASKKPDAVYAMVDATLDCIRAGFGIIHRMDSPFEELLLERFCEAEDLTKALPSVYGYNEFLATVSEIATGGFKGSRFDWTDELELGRKPVESWDVTITCDSDQHDAALAVLSRLGITMTGGSPNKSEALVAWMAREGFDQAQSDEILADMGWAGATAADVMDLGLDPAMTTSEIEAVFYRRALE